MADERNDLTASSIERKLRALKPKPSSIDRDRLIYLAGQQAVLSRRYRPGWVWPALTAVSTTAALVMAILLINGEVNRPTARDVVQQPKKSESRGQGEGIDVSPRQEAIIVGQAKERPAMVSERGLAMLALRRAVSEAGVGVLSGSRSAVNPDSAPSLWDEVRTANLREAMANRNPRGAEQGQRLLGIFSVGTKS